MDVLLATRNVSKIEQIKAIFADSPVNILTLDDVGIVGEGVENGETLWVNAYIKAKYAFDRLSEKMIVMAEDSGTFIRALGGAPGVRSARWAGLDATTGEITRYTLEQLEGVTDRFAQIKAEVVIIHPDGKTKSFSGCVGGQILKATRMKPQPNMPYSGIFVCEGTGLVWAEMDVEFENKVSHRGKAFRKVRAYLESLC
jgi:XTP/dITP diphosphohydrolase